MGSLAKFFQIKSLFYVLRRKGILAICYKIPLSNNLIYFICKIKSFSLHTNFHCLLTTFNVLQLITGFPFRNSWLSVELGNSELHLNSLVKYLWTTLLAIDGIKYLQSFIGEEMFWWPWVTNCSSYCRGTRILCYPHYHERIGISVT